MPNIETYNRVPALVSPLMRRLFLSGYAVLFLVVLVAVINMVIMPSSRPYYLAVTLGSILMYGLLYAIDKKRVPRCRFCQTPLVYIVRPFLLTPQYLAMEGTKLGNYFFTRCIWGKLPLTQRWAKISRRSLACHHCRLTEAKLVEHYETVSDSELAEIEAKRAAQ